MPLQQTSGAASYDAFGGGAPIAAKYIEDFFQTWLRTGTGSSTTVTTGLNGAINETMVWTKSRSAATNHKLTDTARGVTKALSSNTTGAEVTDSQGLTAFSSTGYTIGTNTDYNNSGATYVDWQWVATPKFFDIVTYTGNGDYSGSRLISHNLGTRGGAVIVKPVSATGDWKYTHINGAVLLLNSTEPRDTATTLAGGFPALNSSTDFALVPFGGSGSAVNANGVQYVAYLFAHDAGGFGLTGTDNVISCGSYTGNGSATGPVVNLGYEPQWLLVKNASFGTANWLVYDNMRGLPVGSNPSWLYPNTSAAEVTDSWGRISPTATGFQVATADAWLNQSGDTIIYIAIRRGPMKTPTTGTSVFSPTAYTSTNVNNRLVNTGIVTDLAITRARTLSAFPVWGDRLRGDAALISSNTGAESVYADTLMTPTVGVGNSFSAMNGYGVGSSPSYTLNNQSFTEISWAFRRAPGFMDVVCYRGTGTTFAQQHNLAAVPGLVICKRRNGADSWFVYADGFGGSNGRLNSTDPFGSVMNRITAATSTTFTVAGGTEVNQSGGTYVAYLFASCPGVSKVFNYTGNGSSQTINCGFTGGARFVMIKRTDSTGDWYVWDTARGIVANNDPHLSLNSTAAEVTTNDTIDTDSTGFVVNQVAATNVNVNGASYIGLAIA